MDKYSQIVWRNIYYMLCYAVDEFSAMTRSDNISFENIETTADLFGELLDQTFLIVYNEMVFRQYSLKNYNTNRPRGRLNIEKSYATGVIGKGQINCNVFSFNIDNQLNQAVKAGFLSLLNFGDKNVLSSEIRNRLIQDALLMEKITSKPLTLDLIGDECVVPDWYKPIRFVLLIIYYHYMASDKDGDKPLYKLSDRERLCWIYEKFVRNYCAYKYAATGKLYVSNGEYYVRRKSGYRKCEIDLLLESQTNALIVDMKWYENPQNRSSPENMRQLYDYMNGYNQRFYGRHYEMSHVNGLLLYADARTSEENWEFYGDSSKVYWQTIGLDQDWDKLTSDLDTILLGYLQNEEHP